MKEFEDILKEKRRKFVELLKMARYPKPGTYDVEVDEVLDVGEYLVQPEVAIVRDVTGKIWAIPEDINYDKPGNRLVSRWDVVKGMKLRVVVSEEDGERDIEEVVIINK